MINEVIDQVLDSAISAVQSLGLQHDGQPIPVVKRKLPSKEETLDPSTLICVNMGQTIPRPRRPFTGFAIYQLPVEITLISPNRGDTVQSVQGLGDWYGQVRDLFARTSRNMGDTPIQLPPGTGDPVAAVLWVRAGEGVFLDRPKLNDAYDYQAQQILIAVIVPTRP